jgi:hypothetical protein
LFTNTFHRRERTRLPDLKLPTAPGAEATLVR